MYITLGFIIIFSVYIYYGNNVVKTTNIEVKSSKIDEVFDGYRVLHLSDYHSKYFGKDQKKIVSKIKDQNPDIIVITGDLVDRRRYEKKENAMNFLDNIKSIAPIYYVTGNHEWWSHKYKGELYDRIKGYGINILDDQSIRLHRKDKYINLYGVNDPAKYYSENDIYESHTGVVEFNDRLVELSKEMDKQQYNILLSHRPELIEVYKACGFDLVLAGHAHGGQFRIPFIGGVISPQQGILPKYDSGKYEVDNTSLIVSRGIGNSSFPIRINNNPEIILITLKNS